MTTRALKLRQCPNCKTVAVNHTCPKCVVPTAEVEQAEHVTTFDGPEPETPTFHYTPNGIFLRMDEHALQALAIMAQVYLSTSTDQRRLITAYGAYECAVDELAEQISDAT